MDNQAQTSGISQEGFPTIEDGQNTEQLTLFTLQDMAVKMTNSIASLQNQLKTAREMLSDTYLSHPSYHQSKSEADEATKKLKATKLNISRMPEVISLEEQIKSLRHEVSDKKSSVTSYALEVFRQTGKSEFDQEGEVYEIKTKAVLVKKK